MCQKEDKSEMYYQGYEDGLIAKSRKHLADVPESDDEDYLEGWGDAWECDDDDYEDEDY
jgi:ribosome modulation factor